MVLKSATIHVSAEDAEDEQKVDGETLPEEATEEDKDEEKETEDETEKEPETEEGEDMVKEKEMEKEETESDQEETGNEEEMPKFPAIKLPPKPRAFDKVVDSISDFADRVKSGISRHGKMIDEGEMTGDEELSENDIEDVAEASTTTTASESADTTEVAADENTTVNKIEEAVESTTPVEENTSSSTKQASPEDSTMTTEVSTEEATTASSETQEDSTTTEVSTEIPTTTTTPKAVLEPKMVEQPAMLQFFTPGEPFVLVCKAASPSDSSPVTYSWTKNGRPTGERLEPGRMVVRENTSANGNLLFVNPGLGDVGTYQCVAENEHGKVFSAPSLLMVREKEATSVSPPAEKETENEDDGVMTVESREPRNEGVFLVFPVAAEDAGTQVVDGVEQEEE